MSEPAAQAAGHHHYDPEANRIGMWLFLATELILFGGIFLVYAVYYHNHPHPFEEAALDLDKRLGALNTVVLLTSSLTVALAVGGVERGRRIGPVVNLGITVLLAGVFMVIKYFEWTHKFHVGLYPGSEVMVDMPEGQQAYFGIYYLATGLHGLHVLVGMAVLTFVAVRILQGRVTRERGCLVVNCGLYWHLVDLVWIYIFPLFYLIH